jgi:hypothetical protein
MCCQNNSGDLLKPENASATYTGDLFVFASSVTSSSAAVTLRATIQDPPVSATDPFQGDIRNATVTFVDRGNNNAVLGTANLPVNLINASDSTTGSVFETVSLPINTTTGSTQYTIGIIVRNYYTDNNSAEDTVVTVSQPIATGFITGGGNLVANASAGTYAATANTQENFGFNVKFNKSGTNLQGRFNTIVRHNGHDYQIKSTAMTSLGIFGTTQNQAQFDAKANLTDITNPNCPISLFGNLTLHVTMTDNGDPGNWTTPDTIGITLWNGTTLLFSSNWSGTKTVEQAIAGGNLVVHHAQLVAGGSATGPGVNQVLTLPGLQPIVAAAIAEWQAAGVPPEVLATLQDTPVEIADLPGAYIGRESANGVIVIDTNAAGHGWFIDSSFTGATNLPGAFNSPAAGQVDLLTVVAHELGHVLGIAELTDPNDVMFQDLAVGVRKLPTVADVLAAGLQPYVPAYGLADLPPHVSSPVARFAITPHFSGDQLFPMLLPLGGEEHGAESPFGLLPDESPPVSFPERSEPGLETAPEPVGRLTSARAYRAAVARIFAGMKDQSFDDTPLGSVGPILL